MSAREHPLAAELRALARPTNGHRHRCECLCRVNHPGAPACTGSAESELEFSSVQTGPLMVPMCLACVQATLQAQERV